MKLTHGCQRTFALQNTATKGRGSYRSDESTSTGITVFYVQYHRLGSGSWGANTQRRAERDTVDLRL